MPNEPEPELAMKPIRINLTGSARKVVEDIREETGVPNTTAMERLLEWYASLPAELRLGLLNRSPGDRRKLAVHAIAEMGGPDAVLVSGDSGVALAAVSREAGMSPEEAIAWWIKHCGQPDSKGGGDQSSPDNSSGSGSRRRATQPGPGIVVEPQGQSGHRKR